MELLYSYVDGMYAYDTIWIPEKTVCLTFFIFKWQPFKSNFLKFEIDLPVIILSGIAL